MKSRFVLSLFAAVAAVALVGATPAHALSIHNVKATLLVPASLTPDDVHVTFTGTGGLIADPTATPDAGDGNPNVAAVGGIGNRVDVTWTNKLAALDTVVIRFTCPHGQIGVDVGGTWTNGGNVIGNVVPASVTLEVDPADPVPGASPMVMLLIAMAVAAGGAVMLRRRVEA